MAPVSEFLSPVLLLLSGAAVAGFIDSIVGGGGLITVPIYMMILGPSTLAVGTNKVGAFIAQLAALFIYRRSYFVPLSTVFLSYSLVAGSGAAVGALLAKFLTPEFYHSLPLIITPVILMVIISRSIWLKSRHPIKNPAFVYLALFLSGLYDGIAGPGGGTLLFLGLFLFSGLSINESITVGKLCNAATSFVSLATYTLLGKIDLYWGLMGTIPLGLGAFLGARWTSKNINTGRISPQLIARSALVVVSLLMLLRFYI